MSDKEFSLEEIVVEDAPKPRKRQKRKKKSKEVALDESAEKRASYLDINNFTSKLKTQSEINDMDTRVRSFYGRQNSIIESFESLFHGTKRSESERIGKFLLCIWMVMNLD